MEPTITVKEIAKLFQVNRSTINKWIQQGKLNAFKLPGGDNRVRRSDLLEFMKEYGIPPEVLEDFASIRVLIVEDDGDIQGILEETFKREEEFDVRVASTGYQAGIITGQYMPHVIILDISLGDIDGRDVCNNLRENPIRTNTVIIGISGVIETTEEEMLKQGFDAYYEKPFDIEELVDRVKELVRASSAKRSHSPH